jgi:hypothetical protein
MGFVGSVTRAWPRLRPCWAATAGSLGLAWLVGWGLYLPWRIFVDAHFGAGQIHFQHQMFAKSLSKAAGELPLYLLFLVTVVLMGFALQALPAAIGFARARWAREPWAWAIAGWMVAYLAALAKYTFFIRLTLPLTPLLAVAAGLGLDHLLARRTRLPGRFHWGPACAAVIMALMALQARQTLSWRTDGYREASGQITQYFPTHGMPGGSHVLTQLISPLTFYQPGWPAGQQLRARPPLGAFGRRFYLIVDPAAYTYQYVENDQIQSQWRPWMHLRRSWPVARAFPGPLQSPSLETPAGHLRHSDNPPPPDRPAVV